MKKKAKTFKMEFDLFNSLTLFQVSHLSTINPSKSNEQLKKENQDFFSYMEEFNKNHLVFLISRIFEQFPN